MTVKIPEPIHLAKRWLGDVVWPDGGSARESRLSINIPIQRVKIIGRPFCFRRAMHCIFRAEAGG